MRTFGGGNLEQLSDDGDERHPLVGLVSNSPSIEHLDLKLDILFSELLTVHSSSQGCQHQLLGPLRVSTADGCTDSLPNAFTSPVERMFDVISSPAGVYFCHWPRHVPVSHRSRKRCIPLRDWAGRGKRLGIPWSLQVENCQQSIADV